MKPNFEYNYVDAHCHAYGFKLEDLKKFSMQGIVILAVSEDFSSSIKLINYSEQLPNLIVAIGLHPWNIKEKWEEELERVIKLIRENKHGIKAIGEVGLDKKFVPESFEKQLIVFRRFVELAKEYNLPLNLHAPNAWKDVLNIITNAGIKRANFHWYTGPINVLKEIEAQGYFISLNPALKIQKKHRRIAEVADLSSILTESDGPYKYRGLFLNPSMIPDLVKEIANIKEIDLKEVKEKIIDNFKEYLS